MMFKEVHVEFIPSHLKPSNCFMLGKDGNVIILRLYLQQQQ